MDSGSTIQLEDIQHTSHELLEMITELTSRVEKLEAYSSQLADVLNSSIDGIGVLQSRFDNMEDRISGPGEMPIYPTKIKFD